MITGSRYRPSPSPEPCLTGAERYLILRVFHFRETVFDEYFLIKMTGHRRDLIARSGTRATSRPREIAPPESTSHGSPRSIAGHASC